MAGEFDTDAARKAGYSDKEIADYLGQSAGFDTEAARKSGYQDHEIVTHITGKPFAAAVKVKPTVPPAELDPTAAPGALDPTAGMSGTDKFLAGAGKAVADTGTGLTQIAGKVLHADPVFGKHLPNFVDKFFGDNQARIDEQAKLDKPLMNTGAGMAGNVAGNVAMLVAPGGALKGAGAAAKLATKLPALAEVAAPLAAGLTRAGAVVSAANAPRTLKGAAAAGAGMGAIQPVTTAEGETGRLQNAGLGAAGGTVGTLGGRLIAATGRTIKAAAEPLYEKGQDAILGRMLTKAAGANASDVAARLRAGATPAVGPFQPGMEKTVMGELVPGSVPTVGQAAENPAIAAIERTATATSPEVTNAVSERLAAQNRARADQLENMAGSGGRRDAAEAARETAAGQMYGAARQGDIERQAAAANAQIDRDAPRVGLGAVGNVAGRGQAESIARALKPSEELVALSKRPDFAGYIAGAKRLAANHGLNMENPLESLQGLHYIKLAIDDALAPNAANPLARNAKSATMDMKQRLLGEIDKISPEYSAARQGYAAASRPITQMDIAQELVNKARNPLTEVVQPSAFARNLNDKTAERVTGIHGATLEGVMEPQQMQTLGGILADLRRAEMAKNAGRGPGSDTVQKLAYSNLIDQSGMPTFLRNLAPAQVVGNLAGRGADAVYGRANREMADRAAQTMLDPGLAASLMEKAQAARGAARSPVFLPRAGAATAVSLPNRQ